jgi:hypothetical protein
MSRKKGTLHTEILRDCTQRIATGLQCSNRKNKESYLDAKEKGQVRQEKMKDLPKGQECP